MKPFETFEHNGYTVKLYQDEDVEAPDNTERDMFLVTTDNRYFAPKHPKGFTMDGCRNGDYAAEYDVFRLYAYIHSGVALSLSQTGQFADQWDAGQIGFVLVQKSAGFENPRGAAESYVETWNQYLSGDVWYYTITDPDGNDIDSCGGFYGIEYAREQAKEACPVEHALVGGELEDSAHDETLA